MRFIFDAISLRVFFLFFAVVIIFGFFLYTAGEPTTMDYEQVDDGNLTPITITTEQFVLFPEVTLKAFYYNESSYAFESTEWTAIDETTMSIRRIDVNTGNIYGNNQFFGQMGNGYDDMVNALSGAPYLFNALLYILPLGVFFMILRSFSASW